MNLALYLNRFCSSFADYGLMFLIPLIVFQSTGDAALAGLAFSIEYLAKVLFGPLTGLMIDRFGAVKLIWMANLVRAFACGITVLIAGFEPSFSAIIVLAVLNGLGFTLNFMSQESLLTELVPKKDFVKAQAHIQTLEQIALVTAPVVFSFALLSFTPGVLLFCFSGLFSLSLALLIYGVAGKTFLPPPDADQTFLAQLKNNFTVGQTYLLRSRPLQKVVASTFLINLIYGTLLAIGAVAVTGLFEKDANAFAVLQSSGAIASILVLSFVAKLASRFTPTQLGFTAFVLMSSGGVIAGLAPTYLAFWVGAVLILSFDGLFNVYIRTRRMEIIERKDFGKAIGLLMIVNNLSKPLSGFIVFLLAPFFTVTQVLLCLTALTVVLTLGLKLFRKEEIKTEAAQAY